MVKPYLYIWRYQVPPEKEAEFIKAYGPEGDWVLLFRQTDGYQKTLLLKDIDLPGSYTSIDMWESYDAFKAFREDFSLAFEVLDKRCENLTAEEVQIGRYEML